MARSKSKNDDEKMLLSQAVRDWLSTSTKISGIAGLATAVGEPTEAFRVRLSRNRWSKRILQRLLDETNLAGTLQELASKYTFTVSERTTRDHNAARVNYDVRSRIDTLTADEPQIKQVFLDAALSEREIDHIFACKMTQKPIEGDFQDLLRAEAGTLVNIWKITEDIEKDPAVLASFMAKTSDRTFRDDFLVKALEKKCAVRFHFLVDCPDDRPAYSPGEDRPLTEKESRIKAYLTDLATPFWTDLKHKATSPAQLQWSIHFLASELLIDVFDNCWIHILPPLKMTGWVLFDNEGLRARLQKVSNPWKYTTLAAPISREVVIRTLKRLGYEPAYAQGWAFTANSGKRQYDLQLDRGDRTKS